MSHTELALVTGASGGVGAALVQALRGGDAQRAVIGLDRSNAPPIDVTDMVTSPPLESPA